MYTNVLTIEPGRALNNLKKSIVKLWQKSKLNARRIQSVQSQSFKQYKLEVEVMNSEF